MVLEPFDIPTQPWQVCQDSQNSPISDPWGSPRILRFANRLETQRKQCQGCLEPFLVKKQNFQVATWPYPIRKTRKKSVSKKVDFFDFFDFFWSKKLTLYIVLMILGTHKQCILHWNVFLDHLQVVFDHSNSKRNGDTGPSESHLWACGYTEMSMFCSQK